MKAFYSINTVKITGKTLQKRASEIKNKFHQKFLVTIACFDPKHWLVELNLIEVF